MCIHNVDSDDSEQITIIVMYTDTETSFTNPLYYQGHSKQPCTELAVERSVNVGK